MLLLLRPFLFIVVIIIIVIFFCYIFYLRYANKIRAVCIIVPYSDGLKAPIRLLGRGRSCLGFARSGMFELDIALKKKLSGLFNTVLIHE